VHLELDAYCLFEAVLPRIILAAFLIMSMLLKIFSDNVSNFANNTTNFANNTNFLARK